MSTDTSSHSGGTTDLLHNQEIVEAQKSKLDAEFPVPPPKAVANRSSPDRAESKDADTNFAAPPPKIASNRTHFETHDAAAARAVAVAVAAAASAAPAQKERLIEQIAVQMMGERSSSGATSAGSNGEAAAQPAAPEGPPRNAATYQPPSWAGVPSRIPYSVEVMKMGTIVEQRDVHLKDHYTFGRAPTHDFVLEHPSSSRLHAVLQYRGEDGAAFVYDAGSVHGTFVNKARVKGRQYVRINVGDQLRFGQSSRIFLIGGPDDLMPPEDDTPMQKKQKSLIAAQLARQQREAAIAEAQMAAALQGGVSWGMGEDAEEEIEEGGEIDWRAYAQTHPLSDKQQKLAAKIQKKTNKCQALQKEVEKIRAKESKMEEMTAGQLSTLVRNEQEIDKAMEEIEDLEDMLCDSIRDAVGARKQAAQEKKQKKKKKRRADSDEDDDGSSDDDAFYDRTGQVHKKRRAGAAAPAAQDAASLVGKQAELQQQKDKLLAELAQEEALIGQGITQQASGEGPEGGVDALDAFMDRMEVQLEQDKVGDLKKSIQHIDDELAGVEHLLKIADPEGYFRPGSHAAETAKRRAAKAREIEAQRLEAEERQRKAREAAKLAEHEVVLPEVEEEEDTPQDGNGVSAAGHRDGSHVATGAQQDDTVDTAAPLKAELGAVEDAAQRQAGDGDPMGSSGGGRTEAGTPGGDWGKEDVNVLQGDSGEGGGLRMASGGPGGSMGPPPPKGKATSNASRPLPPTHSPGEGRSRGRSTTEEIQAKVKADLALLAGSKSVDEPDAMPHDEEEAVWKPPEGQTGDGRTKLNDLLGY